MARALRIQYPGAFYHITDRGIERRHIFADDADRNKFLSLLSKSLNIYRVVLYAYTMMDNHFHMIIQTQKGNCSEFMRHFNISYTGWFNRRHHRSGNLYQGRYQAYLIDADNYILEVSRYLHLNPVRVRSNESLEPSLRWRLAQTYPWSSLSGYVNELHEKRFINYKLLLSMVGGRSAYRSFIMNGLNRGVENPLKALKGRIILGDDNFVKQVTRHSFRGSLREQPSFRNLTTKVLEPEVVMGILVRECGVVKKTLQQRRTMGILRGMVAELLYRYCEITQTTIGRMLGDIDYMAVAQLRKRLRAQLDQNKEVRKRYHDMETKIQTGMSNV